MAQISYTNKVALNENPDIADINKVTDDDMNEIKSVVNANYNNTIQITNSQPTDSDNKIWIDTGEVSAAATEITNEYSTSTGLGYSANYINNLFTYSTTEQRVGTWIDGKPLYRKVYNFTTPSSADVDSVIFTAPNNIDTMVNLYGMLTSANARFTLNSYYSTSYYIATYYNPTDGIRAKVGSSLVDRSGVAILEYTKTTD